MSSPPSATKTTTGPGQPSLIRKIGTEGLVRETFDDVALLIGSVAVIHHLDDDLTWTLMKRLDRIRVRLLRDLKGISRGRISSPQCPSHPESMPPSRSSWSATARGWGSDAGHEARHPLLSTLRAPAGSGAASTVDQLRPRRRPRGPRRRTGFQPRADGIGTR